MTRKKTPRVEIVPHSEAALVQAMPTESPRAMLERLVRERVDEILAERGADQLDTDFRTREVATEMMRRQTVFERRRWSIYFEKWGCRRCDDTEAIHACSGYCAKCHGLLSQRLAKIKRDYDAADTERDIQKQIDHLTSRSRTARSLLGDGEK